MELLVEISVYRFVRHRVGSGIRERLGHRGLAVLKQGASLAEVRVGGSSGRPYQATPIVR